MRSTLVLNASYAPLNNVPATRAVALLKSEKAVSLVDSPVIFHSSTDEIAVPYVILRKEQIKDDFRFNRKAPFTRFGMYIRDGFTCAYCGFLGYENNAYIRDSLTIDHVVPRKLGGKTSFLNCVTACRPCNHKKGAKTLHELGWTLNAQLVNATHLEHLFSYAPSAAEGKNAWLEYLTMFQPSLAYLAAN